MIFIFILSFSSCQLIPYKDQPQNDIKRYDGSYSVSFICGDICMANAIIEIKDGAIDGQVQNIKQQSFYVIGYVSQNGDLQLQSISVDSEESIEAYGTINNNGTVNGTYQVDDRNCKLLGFCFKTNRNEIVKQYDGTYQIELIRAGKQMATSQFTIKNGEFHTSIATINNDLYKLDGKISKEGNIIFNTLFSNKDKGLTVIGTINKEGVVKGDYYTNSGSKGVFSGKKINK